jgi:hypothetical protein
VGEKTMKIQTEEEGITSGQRGRGQSLARPWSHGHEIWPDHSVELMRHFSAATQAWSLARPCVTARGIRRNMIQIDSAISRSQISPGIIIEDVRLENTLRN